LRQRSPGVGSASAVFYIPGWEPRLRSAAAACRDWWGGHHSRRTLSDGQWTSRVTSVAVRRGFDCRRRIVAGGISHTHRRRAGGLGSVGPGFHMVSATRGESNRGQANINLRGSCGRCGHASRPWGAIARRPTIRPPGDYHSSNSAFVEKLTVTFNARSISALEILEQTDLHNQVPSAIRRCACITGIRQVRPTYRTNSCEKSGTGHM